MNCISCGIEVSPSFKHAFSQNICPACGGSLIDEESLALIEDLGTTLSSEAALRAETAHKLAVALVARYDIQIRGNQPVRRAAPVQQPAQQAPVKMAHSATQQLIKSQEQQPNIITAEELQKIGEQESITEHEREAMMADAVSKRYNLVDQIASEGLKMDAGDIPDGVFDGNPFSEGDEVPILEQERLMRLQKQQQAMSGGGGRGSFRRGS